MSGQAPRQGSGQTEAAVAEAVARIAAGEAIGLPTETVYGLAADAANRDAVESIYRIKGRPADHPLIVHVLDAEQARAWAQWTPAAERLAAAFWPGPLTLVLLRRPGAAAWSCAGQQTIALRCPSHPLAREVMARLVALGVTGIAAPSANRFGRVSPTTAAHVRADLGDDVSFVLDGGPSEVGIESTIVDLSRGPPALLRPGQVGATEIETVLGEPVRTADAEAPRVPGALPSHYAPRTPLALVTAQTLPARLAAERAEGRLVAVWSVAPVPAGPGVRWYRRPDSADAMAHALYRSMRDLDEAGVDLILVERPAGDGRWAAIDDRLTRAAAPPS